MDSDFKFPSTPTMPLFPLSPERVNAARQSQTPVPHSPSLPDLGSSKHFHTSSDVQAMVSRFNALDIKDHAALRKKDAAALKRAEMGREEAENELKKTKEEVDELKRDREEGREREKKVMKRVDTLMEELHRSKETQNHAQTLYEKEIRRARKETFKASSALLKLQEELKAARNALKLVQSDLEAERTKCGKREQQTFEAHYQLVGVQEELDRAQAQIKVVEEERDALKTNLKEEEVARIAAEGRVALPPSSEDDDEFASPRKVPQPRIFTPMKDEQSQVTTELRHLREELATEQARRGSAEAQIDFMKMECQFQCCSCRVAERQRTSYIHDGEFEGEVQRIKSAVAGALTPPSSDLGNEMDTGPAIGIEERRNDEEHAMSERRVLREKPSIEIVTNVQHHQPPQPLDFATSATQKPLGNPEVEMRWEANSDLQIEDVETDKENRSPSRVLQFNPEEAYDVPHTETYQTEILRSSRPATPVLTGYREVTTTTTIPLAEAKTPTSKPFFSPAISKEEAIEILRQRRGRARSVAGTPKKPLTENATPRRDISAPERMAGTTPRPRGRLMR